MHSAHLFARPAFVPEFSDYSAFGHQAIGITGHRGVLGGILYSRAVAAGIRTEAYPGDVNDEQALTDWFAGKHFSHFFHFAAIVPVTRVEQDPVLAYRTNVIGTFNVCSNLARNQRHCWLFLASSSHVYRPTAKPLPIAEDAANDPPTFYGVTKLAAERVVEPLLAKLEARYCIGRIFSFSHERQKGPYLVPSLRAKIAELETGTTLEVENPSSVRDIQDADAIIDCVLHLARKRAAGTVNIGTGAGQSVKDVALAIARALDKRIKVTGTDRAAPGALIADTRKLRALLK
jgi:nucleoside-diphosphate-sugar epimerase